MELTQLYYFVKVAELQHFTRSASELHISQPSLSKSIANLEEELGVPLFEREKKRVYLNDYGRAFYKRVSQVLLELDDATEEIRDMAFGTKGDIYISSSFSFEPGSLLYQSVYDFYFDHPEIRLHVFHQDNAKMKKLLMERQIDFAISAGESLRDPSIADIRLFSIRLGISVGENHPLAGKKSVWLRELADYTFFCNNTSPDTMDSIYDLCGKAGFQPKILYEGDNPEIIGDAISKGMGLGFISKARFLANKKREQESGNNRKTVFIEVLDEYSLRNFTIHYLKNRYLTTGARMFLETLLDAFEVQEEDTPASS